VVIATTNHELDPLSGPHPHRTRYANRPTTRQVASVRVVPGGDDEKVEAVPRVGEVRSSADETHGDDLDAQFDGEEGEDEVIEAVEDAAARRRADVVAARPVHAERQAVEQDHAHADPLEPRDPPHSCQGVSAQMNSTRNQFNIPP